jgi:FimV-like protein
MGDDAGAVEILAEVVAEGDEAYGREAAKLLAVIRGELP